MFHVKQCRGPATLSSSNPPTHDPCPRTPDLPRMRAPRDLPRRKTVHSASRQTAAIPARAKNRQIVFFSCANIRSRVTLTQVPACIAALCPGKCSPGEVAEWSNAAVLKTVDPHGSGGSNPSLSASKQDKSNISTGKPDLRAFRIRPDVRRSMA